MLGLRWLIMKELLFFDLNTDRGLPLQAIVRRYNR